MEFILESQDDESAVDLFMIEEIDAEKNLLVLANYIYDKKINYPVSDEEMEIYTDTFDVAISKNIFLFVEYDEKKGIIIRD